MCATSACQWLQSGGGRKQRRLDLCTLLSPPVLCSQLHVTLLLNICMFACRAYVAESTILHLLYMSHLSFMGRSCTSNCLQVVLLSYRMLSSLRSSHVRVQGALGGVSAKRQGVGSLSISESCPRFCPPCASVRVGRVLFASRVLCCLFNRV